MSSVTDMFVIIGDTFDERAEDTAPKVADIIRDVMYPDPDDEGRTVHMPVISLCRDDWQQLQGGHKAAGSAAIWFAWNHAHPEDLVERLKAEGFTSITVWWHGEDDGRDEKPPRVVSW